VGRVVRDLVVREADHGRAGDGMRLVAQAVVALLGRRAVVAQAVALDDQVQFREVEVDAVAVHDRLGCRRRQARRAREWHE
jgi:hypothetical protein